MGDTYSNETLGVMIQELKKVVDSGFKQNYDNDKATHKRLDYTNGRVRSLEVWRGFITGGLVIIGIVVGYLINLILN